MALIPDDFVRRLVDDTDLVSLIGEAVELKKAGGEYTACCPFHDEKTPSFTVSPRKQFYHCFGCGAHGDAVAWEMEYGRRDFPGAVEALAARLGRDVPRERESAEQVAQRKQRASLKETLRQAAAVYCRKLKGEAAAAAYLRDERGLSGETARDFLLGWAPDDYGTLRDDPAFDNDALFEAGMLAESEDGRRYDRFRGRVMFPIREVSGAVAGFGGRLIGDGKPKYLNSPETPTFDKRRLLYGLHEYARDNQKQARLLVVEGYMDVVMLAEHDISAVATLGTAVTPEQVALAYRHTQALMFVFDGDDAGQKAMWKALENVLPHLDGDNGAKFVILPDGRDPDDMARELGGQAFLTWLSEHALTVSDMLIHRLPLRERLQPTSMDGRARLVRIAAALIARTPPGVYRDMLTEAVRTAWGIKAKTLQQAITDAGGAASGGSTPPPDGQQGGLPMPETGYTPGWRSAWEGQFARSKEGNIKASLHNVILILENHELLAGMFAMDAFANQIVLTRSPPWHDRTGQLDESDGTEVAAWIGDPRNYGLTVSSSMVLEAIEAVAKRRRFHPVLDYLDGLTWDGTPRLEHMLADFFGAEQNEYTAACGRNMLMAAVARVRFPGSKVDEMIILEGEQGAGKSSAVRALCGPQWFAEMLESPQNKDFYQILAGRWIVEIPELQAFNKADRNKIKAAVSAQEDTYRPSYGRYARQFPRQNIFIGTTNDEGYLKDETGARRFMPVRCTEVRVNELISVRDQLWAEADALVRRGEPWYRFPEMAREEQDRRFDVDVWEETVSFWLDGHASSDAYLHRDGVVDPDRPIDEVTIAEIMRHALRIESAKQSKPDQMRVGAILRHLGWHRAQRREEKGRRWCYRRPKTG